MSYKLALMTIGILGEPVGHKRVQGFINRIPSVYQSADASDGFHARWVQGEVKLPAYYPQPIQNERIAATLSLWSDLESVAAFSYHGSHGEALAKRRDWFDKSDVPGYVAWWVDADHAIDWAEGCERIHRLHEDGPTAYAFNFAKPFDCEGKAFMLDRELVKAKAMRNAQGQTQQAGFGGLES